MGCSERLYRYHNQSNEALVKKLMTTKFPSGLVLMELAEELEARNCELQLHWVRRDLHQLANDLANEKFDHFSPDFRVPLVGKELLGESWASC